jgi:hypothetical protein
MAVQYPILVGRNLSCVAGTINVADGVNWSVSGWLWRWTTSAIAEEIGPGAVTDEILEAQETGVNWLSLADFGESDAAAIRDAIRLKLRGRAEAEFANDDDQRRSSAIELLGELAVLVSP